MTESVTVGQLVERFLSFQKVKHPTRYVNSLAAWNRRMKDKFAHIDATALEGRHTLDYINWVIGVDVPGWAPLPEPRAKATANGDVNILRGAYTHAKINHNFLYRPHFHVHDVSDNVREGFLEQTEFDAIIAVIRAMGEAFLWLRAYLTMAYECGNRKGELSTLKVGQFNRVRRIVRLKGKDTKSGKPRELGLSDELYALLVACSEGKGPNDLLFTRRVTRVLRHVTLVSEERPVGDYRGLWRKVLQLAGIDRKVLLHDFRRSMVNNMIQCGLDRDVVRQYTGHSVSGMHTMLSRYHIVRQEEILNAAKKNEERKLREREIAAGLSGQEAVQ
jgi:integrase